MEATTTHTSADQTNTTIKRLPNRVPAGNITKVARTRQHPFAPGYIIALDSTAFVNLRIPGQQATYTQDDGKKKKTSCRECLLKSEKKKKRKRKEKRLPSKRG
jgi:hypothetical protein